MYGLSLRQGVQGYAKDRSSIVYIGSSGNLRKRIATYLNGYGHTDDIRRFIESHPLCLRFRKTKDHKAAEARLLHDFVERFGELPLLNKIQPRTKREKTP